MEMSIETPPALSIPCPGKIFSQSVLQVLKEDEVLGPLPSILTLELGILPHPMLTGSRAPGRNSLDILHVGSQPGTRPGFDVELVCLVKIRGALREGNIERRFAGQGPSRNLRIYEVRSPGSGMAGHEEPHCCVGDFYIVGVIQACQVVARFMFMAQVRKYVNDSTLMYLGDITGEDDIGGEKN